MAKQMRRSPDPGERRLDATRSRAALLRAAREEFAAKGFAGARVADIAAAAGLNKQLISYYFGGKAGLYRELQRQWLDEEATFADPALALGDLTARYLHEALADPTWTRLALWDGLTQDGEEPFPRTDEDLSDVQRRQRAGELAADLDPDAVLLMLIGAIVAPIALPHMAARLMGVDPQSPDFEQRYGEQLRRVVRRLALTLPDAANP